MHFKHTKLKPNLGRYIRTHLNKQTKKQEDLIVVNKRGGKREV